MGLSDLAPRNLHCDEEALAELTLALAAGFIDPSLLYAEFLGRNDRVQAHVSRGTKGRVEVLIDGIVPITTESGLRATPSMTVDIKMEYYETGKLWVVYSGENTRVRYRGMHSIADMVEGTFFVRQVALNLVRIGQRFEGREQKNTPVITRFNRESHSERRVFRYDGCKTIFEVVVDGSKGLLGRVRLEYGLYNSESERNVLKPETHVAGF